MDEAHRKFHLEYNEDELLHVESELSSLHLKTEASSLQVKQLEVYFKILKLPPEVVSFSNCSEILYCSVNDPSYLFQQLFHWKQYDIALDWVEVHNLQNKFNINELRIYLYLDKNEPEFENALSVLDNLCFSELEAVLTKFMRKFSNTSTRKFFLTYILDNLSNQKLTSSVFAKTEFSLRQELMGCILLEISSYDFFKSQLNCLIYNPILIIEQWIMNKNFSQIFKALELLSPIMPLEHCCIGTQESPRIEDCLCWSHFHDVLENYIGKAVKLPFISGFQYGCESDYESFLSDSPNEIASITDEVKIHSDTMDATLNSCTTFIRSIGERGKGSCESISLEMDKSDYGSLSTSTELNWCLSTDLVHNSFVQEEFDFVGSCPIDLCSNLLRLHKDDTRSTVYCLKLSSILFEDLVDELFSNSSKIDVPLVVKLIQYFLLSTKIKFSNKSNYEGFAVCDYISHWLLFIHQLFNARKMSFLSLETLKNVSEILQLKIKLICEKEFSLEELNGKLLLDWYYVKTLRDNLIKENMLDLAFNVSTKAGLDLSSVWRAKALLFLRSADLLSARDYYRKVISESKGRNSNIVNEIISNLEMLWLMPFGSKPDGNPKFEVENISRPTEIEIVQECIYYLDLYGSHESSLQFYVRHSCWKNAVTYCVNRGVNEKIFVDVVILPSFEKGNLMELWNEIRQQDASGVEIALIIYKSIKYLKSNNYMECLLKIQVLLSDFIEMSKTLAKLYSLHVSSYSELLKRRHYLRRASHCLQTHIDQNYLSDKTDQSSQSSSLILGSIRNSSFLPTCLSEIPLRLPKAEVLDRQYLIQFQEKMSKYFAECEERYNDPKTIITSVKQMIKCNVKKSKIFDSDTIKRINDIPDNLLTVFSKERRLLACIVILVLKDGNGTSWSLIHELLRQNLVCSNQFASISTLVFALMKKFSRIYSVLKNLLESAFISSVNLKEILWPCLKHFKDKMSDKELKNLVSLLTSPKDKMDFFIEIDRLKMAYCHVSRDGQVEDIEFLRKEATRRMDKTITFYCDKWLLSHRRKLKASR